MKTNQFLLFTISVFVLLFSSCHPKEEGPTNGFLGCSNLKLIWETPFTEGSLAGSSVPIIIDDLVAYEKWTIGPNAINETRYLSKDDGAVVSTLDGFFGSDPSYSDGIYHYIGKGNKVIQIDPSTAEIVQEFEDLTSGANRVFGIENYVFHIVTDATQNKLMAYDFESGARQLIASVTDTNEYRMNYEWVVPSIAENGDIWVYYLQKGFDGSTQPSRSKLTLHCYNLAEQESVFEIDFPVIEKSGIGTVEPGQLSNNNIIFYAGDLLFAVDKITGELKWEKDFQWNLNGNPILVDDEKLYVLDGDGGAYRFLVIDVETGDIIGSQTGVSAGGDNMLRYNESIYYASPSDGRLYNMDRHTGKMNYRVEAPHESKNSDRFFQSSIMIDQETGRLYAFDFVSALCFEIVE